MAILLPQPPRCWDYRAEIRKRRLAQGEKGALEGREDESCKQNLSLREQEGSGPKGLCCCPFTSSLKADPGGPTGSRARGQCQVPASCTLHRTRSVSPERRARSWSQRAADCPPSRPEEPPACPICTATRAVPSWAQLTPGLLGTRNHALSFKRCLASNLLLSEGQSTSFPALFCAVATSLKGATCVQGLTAGPVFSRECDTTQGRSRLGPGLTVEGTGDSDSRGLRSRSLQKQKWTQGAAEDPNRASPAGDRGAGEEEAALLLRVSALTTNLLL
ncbi:uncharacterized protein LOC101696467 isoform X2 [Heterocephalus glaber]|uniref:Uncharacterized protein LOC101696467 isoform X2 n=1 Tax=Heterocephalus glaber TaxID=10181 RepID=A0AAX6SRC7_HETGA|nr:uncharacterized protein LOC101696467 isoform X2 [Heterocephalus glaber]